MNSKTLAELALKVWGVTILVSALASVPASLVMVAASPAGNAQDALIRASQIGSILNLVFHAFVGAGLVVWCDRIVDLIVSDDPPLQIEMGTAELQTLAFALVGVFVLVDGLQNVAGAAYTLYSKPKFETETWSYLWARQSESIVRAVVQVAAGVLLVAGRNSIARWWLHLRGEPVEDVADNLDDGAG